jgi:hypothetical protein
MPAICSPPTEPRTNRSRGHPHSTKPPPTRYPDPIPTRSTSTRSAPRSRPSQPGDMPPANSASRWSTCNTSRASTLPTSKPPPRQHEPGSPPASKPTTSADSSTRATRSNRSRPPTESATEHSATNSTNRESRYRQEPAAGSPRPDASRLRDRSIWPTTRVNDPLPGRRWPSSPGRLAISNRSLQPPPTWHATHPSTRSDGPDDTLVSPTLGHENMCSIWEMQAQR